MLFFPIFDTWVDNSNWDGLPPTTVTGAVADGVYLMLAPLPVGTHVIHWTASGGGFLQDITYALTVVPAGG